MKSFADVTTSVINISTLVRTPLNVLHVLNLRDRGNYFLVKSPAKVHSSSLDTCHILSIAQVSKVLEIVHPMLLLNIIAYLVSLN